MVGVGVFCGVNVIVLMFIVLLMFNRCVWIGLIFSLKNILIVLFGLLSVEFCVGMMFSSIGGVWCVVSMLLCVVFLMFMNLLFVLIWVIGRILILLFLLFGWWMKRLWKLFGFFECFSVLWIVLMFLLENLLVVCKMKFV